MRIYHRLSVVVEKKQHVYSLVHLLSLLESQKSEAGYSYDLVSVQPLNQETFDMACDAVMQPSGVLCSRILISSRYPSTTDCPIV